MALVPANECQRAAVGRPGERVQDAELLLINPVGHAVDDLVFLAVVGELRGGAGGEVERVGVVGLDVGHAAAVGRQGGDFLAAIGGYFRELATGAVEHVIVGSERVAVDGLAGRPQQDALLIATYLVAVPLLHRAALQLVGAQHGSGHRRAVVDAVDVAPIVADLVVVAAIGGRLHGSDARRTHRRQYKVANLPGSSLQCRTGGEYYHCRFHHLLSVEND